jgi:D,D-heptose 1,7-bisphosphate phosphatase
MNKAVFLDRDGVIITEKKYLYNPDEVELTEGAVEAIKLLNENGFLVLIVTNQSGVARNYYKESDIPKVHQRINDIVTQAGGRIDQCYYCPHHPNGENPKYKKVCDCRKPEPGMILQGIEEFKVSAKDSYIIGDKMSDLLAGVNANLKQSILVRTGYGEKTELEFSNDNKFPVKDNLHQAVLYIINNDSNKN